MLSWKQNQLEIFDDLNKHELVPFKNSSFSGINRHQTGWRTFLPKCDLVLKKMINFPDFPTYWFIFKEKMQLNRSCVGMLWSLHGLPPLFVRIAVMYVWFFEIAFTNQTVRMFLALRKVLNNRHARQVETWLFTLACTLVARAPNKPDRPTLKSWFDERAARAFVFLECAVR